MRWLRNIRKRNVVKRLFKEACEELRLSPLSFKFHIVDFETLLLLYEQGLSPSQSGKIYVRVEEDEIMFLVKGKIYPFLFDRSQILDFDTHFYIDRFNILYSNLEHHNV